VALALSRVNTQQPQQGMPIDRSTRIGAGALAVVTPAIDINWVSGKALARVGSGFAKQLLNGGTSWKFRQNFYLETENLPAIGTDTFVDFWVGYANATTGNAGNGSSFPAMLTGANQANQAGICMTIGNNYASVNSNSVNNWGCVLNWANATKLFSAAENIPLGELTVLVMVRRQAGIELWRNGVLKATTTITPVSIPSMSFIVGSFVNTTTWCSANDTILAGRSKFEPTTNDIVTFSANPWLLFNTPELYMSAIMALMNSSSSALSAARVDGLTITDFTTATYFSAAQVADILSAAESNMSTQSAVSSAADALATTDSQSSAATFAATRSDSLTTSDLFQSYGTWAASLLDVASVTDSVSASSATGLQVQSDSLSVVDSQSSVGSFVSSIIDSLGIADQGFVGGSTFTASNSDTLSTVEVVSSNKTSQATRADVLTTTDQISSFLAGSDGAINPNLVPKSRWVVFDGGTRLVVFSGTNRVVVYDGTTRIVEF
jgi:hypothetical protein